LSAHPTDGYVLSARNYLEADKLVQLYTLQFGKIRALVKGARKPKSRLGSALELFTESSLVLTKRPSGDLYLLTQAKMIQSHPRLKEDFPTITLLQVMADLLIQSLQDGESDGDLYRLTQKTLMALEEASDSRETIFMSFVLKLLELMGHPLELEICAECQSSLERRKAFLISHRGGVLCQNCCATGPRRLQVTPSGLEILKKMKSLPLEKIHILKMNDDSRKELFLTLLSYMEQTIEKPLKSLEYYLKVMPD
jgi:DNA repair protein RecO (recombination protein O)